MRRDELSARGVQLPVLPTIALGPLPPGVSWPENLMRIGLDVLSTGLAEDGPEAVAFARAAVPVRPLLARGFDSAGLAAAGAAIIEGPAGADAPLYGIGPDDVIVRPVGVSEPAVEAVMDVARAVLTAAQAGIPSALWVAAGPGLEALPVEVVEAKLAVMVEGARQARLYLAKEQFDT
ncbi:MAG: hypothetical protein RIB67_04470 [Miltoncostaeaceae bacterium]